MNASGACVMLADLAEPVQRRAGGPHRVRPVGQVGHHRRPDERIVLDDEHTRHDRNGHAPSVTVTN